MFSVNTNIYNKKTKGPTLRKLFTGTGKLIRFFWQLEFSMCAPRATRHTSIIYSSSCYTRINMGAANFSLHTTGRNVNYDEKQLSGKTIFEFTFYLCRFSKYVSYGFPVINFCNLGLHYETPCILRPISITRHRTWDRPFDETLALTFFVCSTLHED
jgi:hypothetical protein